VEYEGASYRDPFLGEKKEPEASLADQQKTDEIGSLQLDGIAWSPRGSQAILSGQMAGVGDTVAGAEIVAITKNSVTLKYKGKEIILKEKGNS
jgi:hypothetical protein